MKNSGLFPKRLKRLKSFKVEYQTSFLQLIFLNLPSLAASIKIIFLTGRMLSTDILKVKNKATSYHDNTTS